LEDDFEKLDKSVDAYLSRQLGNLMSQEEYKEKNMDKVTTQVKTDIYFKRHAEHVRSRTMHEAIKYWDENSSQTVPALKDRTITNSFVD
jgi:hypothetical protein